MPVPSYRSVGQIAVRLGLVTEAQIAEAVERQKTETSLGRTTLLGQLLLAAGYLTEDGLRRVLTAQKQAQAEFEKQGFSRIGVGDAFRMLGAIDDALRHYRAVLEEYGDCLAITAAARQRIAEIERDRKA